MAKKKINKMMWIVIVIIVILAAAFLIQTMTSYIVKEIPDKDWLVDNCECIERENLICPNGFEVVEGDRMCKKITLDCPSELVIDIEGLCKERITYTNPLLGCSKYDCSGEIYKVK